VPLAGQRYRRQSVRRHGGRVQVGRQNLRYNKRHWNTIALDGSVPSEAIGEWIQDSYHLILASLTRTERAALA
jgi:hypothetical protein